MSAIFGLLRFDDQAVTQRDVDRMGRTMAHRAPDGIHAAVMGPAGLGRGLMRLTEEDLFDVQPVRDAANGLTLVADVRLDNREDLAAALDIADAALRDMPDSALMLAAYRHWGEDFPTHLIGDFAFAIWDARKQSLLVGRDHMGQRPLFYYRAHHMFVFASEAKALWAIEGVPRQLNEDQLGRQLMMSLDRNVGETIYADIHILRGGMTMQLSAHGEVRQSSYWEPHAAPEHVGRDDAYYLATYKRLVEEAIACRVRRLTRPPGLNFSGGFDSGTIAVVAGPVVAARGQKLIAVATVRPKGDDRNRNARAAVSAYRDRPYLDLVLHSRGDETTFTDIEEYFEVTENSGSVNYSKRAMFRIAAERGARLVMDGHGGDYTVNIREDALLGRFLRQGNLVRFMREFIAFRRRTGASIRLLVMRDILPALLPLSVHRWRVNRRMWRGPLRETWRQRFVSADFARDLIARGVVDTDRLREFGLKSGRWEDFQRAVLRRMMTMPPGHDSIAAWEGTVLTRPFHDKRIAEFSLAIPHRLKMRGGAERYLARQAFGGLLAPFTLERVRGNDSPEPDLFDVVVEIGPAALAEARRLDRDGRLSRYIDLDAVAAVVSREPGNSLADLTRYGSAVAALAQARFIAWLDRTNS